MVWLIQRTDPFLQCLKKHKNDHALLIELDKKIQRLKENPESIGGRLAGALHGKRSTRLTGKFRLIFQIDESANAVYLIALDHRRTVYE